MVNDNSKASLLVHTCCAPCFASVFEQLRNDFDVTIFWFNPNIYPLEEYGKRLIEVERYAGIVGVKVINIENQKDESCSWNQLVKKYANESEGRKRCEVCIKYRLLSTAKYAKENGFDYFSTTLSVSPHKNIKMINRIGKELEVTLNNNCHPALDAGSSDNDSGSQISSLQSGMTQELATKKSIQEMARNDEVAFLERDFKKNNGYKRSIELCKEFNIYRQKYCGCIYSMKQ